MSDEHKGCIERIVIPIIHNKSCKVIIPFEYQRKEGYIGPYLHFWLFCITGQDDEDGYKGLVVESCIATGRMDMEKFCRVNFADEKITVILSDVLKNKQGSLQISNLDTTTTWPTTNYIKKRPIRTSLYKPLIDNLEVFYNPETIEYDESKQHWVSVTTPIGELPLLCFPISATMIDPCYCYGPSYERSWVYWLHLSISRRGYTEDQEEWTPMILGDIIGELIGLLARTHLYTSDHTRLTNTNTIPMDNWTNPGTYPDPGLIGRDCEDASAYTLQLLYILRTIPTENEGLLMIQEHLKKYTDCLILGSYYDGPEGYNPHAYVMLFESRVIDEWIDPRVSYTAGISPSPTILIDTVNYHESIWVREGYWDTSVYQQKINEFRVSESFLDTQPPKAWKRILKPYIPSLELYQRKQYGDVVHILTANHHDRALHLICTQPSTEKSCKLGFPMNQMILLEGFNHEHVSVAVNLPASQVVRLRQSMIELPYVRMPIPLYEIPEEIIMNSSEMKLLLRTADYLQYKQQIHTWLKTFDPSSIIPSTFPPTKLAEPNCSFTEIFV